MARLGRFFGLAFVAGLMLSLASCGRGNGKPVYPVTGKVLFQGKPAEGAQITLAPLDENEHVTPRPGAQVKKNGSFRLSTYRSYDGAPAGRYAVTIVYRSPARKEGDDNLGPDLLHGRWADPKTTPLEIEVKEETNELPPFDLH